MQNKERKKEILIHIIQIIIIGIFASSVVDKTFQNDTFFTIALGERTVNYGIEKIDQLVWHQGLNFIHLRWLFDVLIYKIYSLWNYNGIYMFVIIIAIIQGILYYYISNKLTKNKYLSMLFTLITLHSLSIEFAGRAQIISFTLFLLEFYSIEQLLKTNKKRFFIILMIIPILLVNFHASVFPVYFVFYLPYIAQYILYKIMEKLKIKNQNNKIILEKTKILKLIILIIIASMLGMCSPSGIETYKYMFKVMGGISKDIIKELQPVNIMEEKNLIILIFLTFSIIAFTKVKIRLTDLLYITGFIIMSLPTKRCIYFVYLISSICVIRIISDLLIEYKIKLRLRKEYKRYLYIVFIIIVLFYSINRLLENQKCKFIDEKKYPIFATKYISENLKVDNMRIYNHFNFGSYLELNNIPAFIDSRSEMYTKEFNPNSTILEDWTKTNSGIKNYKELFNKYEITHVLLYNEEVINVYIVEDKEWKSIYQDDIFTLYERVNK